MLILENLPGMKSKKADVTAAFPNATLREDEEVYVEKPLGFKQGGGRFRWKVQGSLCQENSSWLESKSSRLLEISY